MKGKMDRSVLLIGFKDSSIRNNQGPEPETWENGEGDYPGQKWGEIK